MCIAGGGLSDLSPHANETKFLAFQQQQQQQQHRNLKFSGAAFSESESPRPYIENHELYYSAFDCRVSM